MLLVDLESALAQLLCGVFIRQWSRKKLFNVCVSVEDMCECVFMH